MRCTTIFRCESPECTAKKKRASSKLILYLSRCRRIGRSHYPSFATTRSRSLPVCVRSGVRIQRNGLQNSDCDSIQRSYYNSNPIRAAAAAAAIIVHLFALTSRAPIVIEHRGSENVQGDSGGEKQTGWVRTRESIRASDAVQLNLI